MSKPAWMLSDLKDEGWGRWTSPDGLSWDSEADALAVGVLGFCGCGIPEETLEWVGGGLQLIVDIKAKVWDDSNPYDYHAWAADVREHFGPERGSEYFFWYWASDRKFTEHGGSVPGWLTELGEQLLADIRRVTA